MRTFYAMDLPTRHPIAREDWPMFCEGWGLTHRGWLVTVSVGDPDGRVLMRDRVLRSLRWTTDGTVAIVADGPKPETVEAADVTAILELRANGAHVGLELARAAQPALLVSFRVAALPEELDGIAGSER